MGYFSCCTPTPKHSSAGNFLSRGKIFTFMRAPEIFANVPHSSSSSSQIASPLVFYQNLNSECGANFWRLPVLAWVLKTTHTGFSFDLQWVGYLWKFRQFVKDGIWNLRMTGEVSIFVNCIKSSIYSNSWKEKLACIYKTNRACSVSDKEIIPRIVHDWMFSGSWVVVTVIEWRSNFRQVE